MSKEIVLTQAILFYIQISKKLSILTEEFLNLIKREAK